MRYTITKEEFEKLDSHLQAEYKADGDDKFVLNVEDGEDTGALKRAKDHEKERRQKAESDLIELKKALATREDELINIRKGAVNKDDVEALEKSYKEKYDKREAELQSQLEESKKTINGIFVDNVATKLASEISTVPELLAREIKARLSTTQIDGRTETRVLDADGKPSALTVDDLKKEILANPSYAPILVGSKASGSGATGGSNGGGAVKFVDMAEADRLELYRKDPDAYRKLRDAS